MQHFFDKRATIVDVTVKEVIDLFTVSTIVALLKSSVAAARVPSPSSRT
jgi:hypothetical protein